jgi:hypothetical protein
VSDENKPRDISDVESMIIPHGTTLVIVDLDRDNERVWLLRSSNSWPKNSGYGFFGAFGPAPGAPEASRRSGPRSGLRNVSQLTSRHPKNFFFFFFFSSPLFKPKIALPNSVFGRPDLPHVAEKTDLSVVVAS